VLSLMCRLLYRWRGSIKWSMAALACLLPWAKNLGILLSPH